MANSSIIDQQNADAKTHEPPIEVGRVSTIELILSVTEPKV